MIMGLRRVHAGDTMHMARSETAREFPPPRPSAYCQEPVALLRATHIRWR